MSELYNEDIKHKFLNTLHEEGTKRTYTRTLKDAYFTEKILKKDLYNFSLSEVEDVIKTKQPFRIESVKNRSSVLRRYIQWAIDNGHRDNKINPLEGVTDEWYENLLDTKRRIAYTKEEIDNILSKTVNAQDKALIALVFEGAWGKSSSELLDLKEDDIDWDHNQVLLGKNTEKERVIDIPQEVTQILFDAKQQYEYLYNNGVKKSSRSATSGNLKHTDYILKHVLTAHTENKDRVAANTIATRLRGLKEVLRLEPFTAQNIRYSGMLYYGYKLKQERGQITGEELDMIGTKFGIHDMDIKGTQSSKRLIVSSIVNDENLEKYYGEDE